MNKENAMPKHHWLVTGASSGIGRAMVVKAASQGDSVYALDVDTKSGQALAAETGATFIHCDVSKSEAWAEVIQTMVEHGLPDRIHLNAGIQIAPPNAPLSDYQFGAMTHERYRRMMGVNVDGVVFGLEALLPHLVKGAAIVVTASLAGLVPYAIDPLYSMSKHAVVGLVRSLGPTLALRSIRINALCPGGIDTAIIPEEQRVDNAIFMTPENIADEVAYLMTVEETGKAWAKVAESKPAFIIRAPGDKG